MTNELPPIPQGILEIVGREATIAELQRLSDDALIQSDPLRDVAAGHNATIAKLRAEGAGGKR